MRILSPVKKLNKKIIENIILIVFSSLMSKISELDKQSLKFIMTLFFFFLLFQKKFQESFWEYSQRNIPLRSWGQKHNRNVALVLVDHKSTRP